MTRTIKKLLVIAKRSAYDMYVGHHNNPHLQALLRSNDQNMMERHAAHQKALATCHELLDRWKLQWVSVRRDELQGSISGVDLVLSVGGDGTVLEASHFLGHQIPLLGVNSDPTSPTEVASKQAEYDATRSTGHLCAATSDTLPLILEEILAGHRECVEVARIATSVGGGPMPPALNDVLAAHPNPAAVTRCSYQILKEQPQPSGSPAAETLPQDSDPGSPTTPASPLVHSRSSGLRVCTATGATAAMRSGGGRPMAALSRELQFKGRVYLDGCHLSREVALGEQIDISNRAPPLRMFLKGR
eukprot:jgi/Mesen1/8884/ME000535S08195